MREKAFGGRLFVTKLTSPLSSRYILPCTIADSTGSRMITLFNDQAQEMIGHSADELYEMAEGGDSDKVGKIFKEAVFKSYLWTLKVKQETYNDENRIKVVGQSMSEYDFAEESKRLIDGINGY